MGDLSGFELEERMIDMGHKWLDLMKMERHTTIKGLKWKGFRQMYQLSSYKVVIYSNKLLFWFLDALNNVIVIRNFWKAF